MKAKVILVILLSGSIIFNICQYNNQKISTKELQSMQTELNSLNEKSNSLNKEISEKEEEISALLLSIENLEESIQLQQSENDSLSNKFKELESAVVEVEIQKEEPKESAEPIKQESEPTQISKPAPSTTDNSTESPSTPIHPNTGEPLQPGESFDDGWGGEGAVYIGDI